MRQPILPSDVPQPLDRELLAWAAGFFDGEGSTIDRSDSRRPGYFQLDVSVPQSSANGVPEVLLTFQRAMLGIGFIYPQPGGLMHKWCAGGRVASELALALLWPWLGSAKRDQARGACDVVARQYAGGRYRPRSARYRPLLVPHANVRQGDDTRIDRAWAAGFLDAEGYFGNPRKHQRADRSTAFLVRASATQHGQPGVPAEVLEKLRTILGGRIERHGEIDDFKWVTEGTLRVRGVLEAVQPWLGSVKLAQATAALTRAESNRVRGDSAHCVRGHVYDRIYIRPDGATHRLCSACERANEKAKRAASGSRPRQLRNPSSDPSRTYAT